MNTFSVRATALLFFLIYLYPPAPTHSTKYIYTRAPDGWLCLHFNSSSPCSPNVGQPPSTLNHFHPSHLQQPAHESAQMRRGFWLSRSPASQTSVSPITTTRTNHNNTINLPAALRVIPVSPPDRPTAPDSETLTSPPPRDSVSPRDTTPPPKHRYSIAR